MPMPTPMPGDGGPAMSSASLSSPPPPPGCDLVLHADRVEAGLDRFEVRLAVGAEVLEELRRPFGHVDAAGDLAVEHPQRVGLEAGPAVLAELAGVRPQVGPQRLEI